MVSTVYTDFNTYVRVSNQNLSFMVNKAQRLAGWAVPDLPHHIHTHTVIFTIDLHTAKWNRYHILCVGTENWTLDIYEKPEKVMDINQCNCGECGYCISWWFTKSEMYWWREIPNKYLANVVKSVKSSNKHTVHIHEVRSQSQNGHTITGLTCIWLALSCKIFHLKQEKKRMHLS